MAKKRPTPKQRRAQQAKAEEIRRERAPAGPQLSPRSARLRLIAIFLVAAMVLSVMVSVLLILLDG